MARQKEWSIRRRIALYSLLSLVLIGFAYVRYTIHTERQVLDASEVSARRGLLYTCRCGWIDMGHARPDNVKDNLWQKLLDEEGPQCKGGAAFRLTFGEMSYGLKALGLSRSYWIRRGLSHEEKERVALAIFTEVCQAYEADQLRYQPFSESGFSSEDLLSDLLSFYRAVRPEADYIRLCGPVPRDSAVAVRDRSGGPDEHKNRSFHPILYTCGACSDTLLPAALKAILPAEKGVLFGDENSK